MSKVSDDRNFIKSCISENGDIVSIEMKKKSCEEDFSYLNTFLKYRPKTEESGIRRKIRNLSTINILYSVYFAFKKLDKSFIKKIEKIKDELSSRNDIFISVLEFIENNEIIYDDLYFWHPGIKYSDVFSLIVEVVPNIVDLYKNYLVESYILGMNPRIRILDVLKNRFNKNLGDFDVIHKDLVLFKLNTENNTSTEYEEISNVGIKRKEKGLMKCKKRIQKDSEKNIKKNYKIVTAYFWKADDEEEEVCDEALNLIGGVDLVKKYTEDVELVLCPSLSYINLTINGKNLTVKMYSLNDLLTKNDRSKTFWIDSGVINESWEYL
jgi:hypothetical protein